MLTATGLTQAGLLFTVDWSATLSLAEGGSADREQPAVGPSKCSNARTRP